MKTMTRYNSIPACFRPPPPPPPPAAATATSSPNLATSLYQTPLGIFSLTWSRALFTRSLHLHLHPHPHLGLSPAIFHLTLNPLLFWNHRGHRKLPVSPSQSVWVFWDLSKARFGAGPGPESGFYIAVLHEGQMALLVGDLDKEAYSKTRVKGSGTDRKGQGQGQGQSLVLRREHVIGRRDRLYTTKVDLGGRSRLVSIELNENCEDGPKLEIRFDQTRVVEVKHLKWKFRGSERIEVDGESILLSWDVYNWLFEVEDCNQDDGCALFTFRFQQQEENNVVDHDVPTKGNRKGERVNWSQDSCGLNYERKKMKKKLMVKSRSPSFSSSSTSSVSSAGSNSVLEWESVEENELKGPTGFSLLVYAWKS